MKKKYEIIVNGEKIIKNVSPKKEKEFLEKYPNAALVSDELGKSQGAGQSQNNQQENTESKSEDGSLEESKSFEVGSVDYFNNQLNIAASKLESEDHKSLLEDINAKIEQRKKDGFTPTIGSFDSSVEDYKKQIENIDLEINSLSKAEYKDQKSVDEANELINNLYKKRDDTLKNYELDLKNYNTSIQSEVDDYDLKSQELVNTYNTNLDEFKTLSREYQQTLDSYEKALQAYQDGDEGYFLANDISTDEITLSSYTSKAPLEWKEDEDGRRLYFDPRVNEYRKEVDYDYDRSLGIISSTSFLYVSMGRSPSAYFVLPK